MGKCCLCGSACNGSLMRTDRRYSRTREWLRAPAVPRLPTGGIALCHFCQRKVYFAKGFLRLLAISLEKEACMPGSRHWAVVRPKAAHFCVESP
jgi:hypothetical protein